MARVLKKMHHKLKKKIEQKEDESRTPLVNNIGPQLTNPVEDIQTQDRSCLNITDCVEEDLQIQTQDFETKGEMVLSILREFLIKDVRAQELKDAAKQVKEWTKLTGITPESKEDLNNYSSQWLKGYLEIVEMSADQNFPILPPKETNDSYRQTAQYLKSAKSLVCSKVKNLIPILKDSGLLTYLVDSYNRRLFAVLYLLLDRSFSTIEVFFLLEWVKQTYFSKDLKGDPDIQDVVFRISDPMLPMDWFAKAKQKFLTFQQCHISTTLQNILLYDENQSVCYENSEETLIKVHVDVIQCLNASIQGAEIISHTLKNAVQRLCCDELHSFVQRYVNAEMNHLKVEKTNQTNVLHCFRTSITCKELWSYAQKIVETDNTSDKSTILKLEEMERQVSSGVEQWLGYLAEDHLKKYFKKEDVHIHQLMETLQHILAPLPEIVQGADTKQQFVKMAYQNVTRAYLKCLIKNKHKCLEKRWGDMEKKMMQDAQCFHHTFTQLHRDCGDNQKILLQKMSEILGCSNVDILKIVCSELYKDFPEESEKFVPGLLKWNHVLSRRLRQEIQVVSQEACQNQGQTKSHPLMCWNCCLCST